MFLSFIVPVYNVEDYLSQCLDTLLSQDAQDYEVICVNDGSTDRSPAILADYAARHENLVIFHQPNSGVAAARNAGLAAARGDYIWFVDSDDLIGENVLSHLKAVLEREDCDLLEIGGYQFRDALSEEEKALAARNALPDNVPGPGAVVWRSLIRLSFLRSHDHAFKHPELTHGEDGQFMFELSLLSPKTAALEEPLYFYRLRSGSAETASNPESNRRRLRSHIAVAGIMKQYLAPGNTAAADRLMAVLWRALYDTAGLPFAQTREALAALKAEGLFPMRPPKEARQICSYMTDRTDLVGKAFDWLYMRQHTRLGFATMWLARHLLKK